MASLPTSVGEDPAPPPAVHPPEESTRPDGVSQVDARREDRERVREAYRAELARLREHVLQLAAAHNVPN